MVAGALRKSTGGSGGSHGGRPVEEEVQHRDATEGSCHFYETVKFIRNDAIYRCLLASELFELNVHPEGESYLGELQS